MKLEGIFTNNTKEMGLHIMSVTSGHDCFRAQWRLTVWRGHK